MTVPPSEAKYRCKLILSIGFPDLDVTCINKDYVRIKVFGEVCNKCINWFIRCKPDHFSFKFKL